MIENPLDSNVKVAVLLISHNQNKKFTIFVSKYLDNINQNDFLQCAISLQDVLSTQYLVKNDSSINWKVFYSYSDYLSSVIKSIEDFDPQKLIILPLYPHYSKKYTENCLKIFSNMSYNIQPEIHLITDFYNDILYTNLCSSHILAKIHPLANYDIKFFSKLTNKCKIYHLQIIDTLGNIANSLSKSLNRSLNIEILQKLTNDEVSNKNLCILTTNSEYNQQNIVNIYDYNLLNIPSVLAKKCFESV